MSYQQYGDPLEELHQLKLSIRAIDMGLRKNPSGGTVELLDSIDRRLERLTWLNEGPDDYYTIDDTISSNNESSYNYDPYVIWAAAFTNNAASGAGINLLVRFSTDYGRIKQAKVPPQTTLRFSDIRGQLGNSFRAITDSSTAEMIAVVTVKRQLGAISAP